MCALALETFVMLMSLWGCRGRRQVALFRATRKLHALYTFFFLQSPLAVIPYERCLSFQSWLSSAHHRPARHQPPAPTLDVETTKTI